MWSRYVAYDEWSQLVERLSRCHNCLHVRCRGILAGVAAIWVILIVWHFATASSLSLAPDIHWEFHRDFVISIAAEKRRACPKLASSPWHWAWHRDDILPPPSHLLSCNNLRIYQKPIKNQRPDVCLGLHHIIQPFRSAVIFLRGRLDYLRNAVLCWSHPQPRSQREQARCNKYTTSRAVKLQPPVYTSLAEVFLAEIECCLRVFLNKIPACKYDGPNMHSHWGINEKSCHNATNAVKSKNLSSAVTGKFPYTGDALMVSPGTAKQWRWTLFISRFW